MDGYGTSGMLTDLYQLTMAYGYVKSGKADTEAAFHVLFRESPFGGAFAVAGGLQQAAEFLTGMSFTDEDLEWLAARTGNDGEPIFEEWFPAYLRDLRFCCDVDAVPEGTVVFANEPLVRVTGPIAQCQLVETALLNIVNFQTLVATKAARVCLAAEGRPVVEFGLRRAQGPDGGVSASRAAYVGGCTGTSNVLAARLFGIPAIGTHAHSWVMAFPSEAEAFEAYADALPNNGTFLVDTYDTLEGVRRAVAAARRLRERGHEMIGVRIDSGDLAGLSVGARAILDEAGFPDAVVVASSDLDEHVVAGLIAEGAAIDVFGVGTRLAAAWDQPALGGVYKLSAIREPGGRWEPRIKVSEETVKVTVPGLLGVRRFTREGLFAGDAVYLVEDPPPGAVTIVDPADPTRTKTFRRDEPAEELLVPVFRGGEPVREPPPLPEVRRRTLAQLERLDDSHKRFLDPRPYPVGLEERLHDLRTRLILEARRAEGG
ncbi:MAG: nicotinate phosphoribosyltransferase [Coriobacteriia bacterium]|nr:nicotinate phosphoribosyltransferase [Coriobacteriia bacterium]